MGLWSKEKLRQFIKENKLVTAQDAQNALKELFAETLQEMLEAEMETHLGYEVFGNRKVPNFAAKNFINIQQRVRFMHRFDMEPLWA